MLLRSAGKIRRLKVKGGTSPKSSGNTNKQISESPHKSDLLISSKDYTNIIIQLRLNLKSEVLALKNVR
jgi:hypothetical protein